VLLGRATLYLLEARGENAVDHVLQLLMREIDRTLAQIGCPSGAMFQKAQPGARMSFT
jgi:(S)-mandelate dehydrogenase